MRSRCCPCVFVYPPISLLGNGSVNLSLTLLDNGYVFYAVPVVSKQSRRLVLPITSCCFYLPAAHPNFSDTHFDSPQNFSSRKGSTNLPMSINTYISAYRSSPCRLRIVCIYGSRDSSVSIGYGLDDRRVGVRFSVRERDISPLRNVQTGFGAHPAFYIKGN
jgi:hypothetical protein